MESDSDWDSISGDGPDIGDVSVSMAAESSRHHKRTPRPPSAEKNMSPAVNKAPLQKTNNEYRNPPRVAEQYRNLNNKARLQGVTTFKDSGEIKIETEDAKPSRKSTPASQESASFHEIELKDNPTQYNMFQAGIKRTQLKDSNENLPYTEFEASDVSPRKNETVPRNQPRNKPRPEYVTRSPVPEATNLRNQRKSADIEAQLRQTMTENEAPKVTKKVKKKSKEKRESVIVNENAHSYDSGDTDKDFTWRDHHHPEAMHVKETASRDVALKTANQYMLLEERYEYENGVRDYHSIYIENQAKMPVIAEKVESLTRRGVQEFFGALQIILDFFIIFTVELLRFTLKQFGRKLIGGAVTAFGDFLMKPVFSAVFNSMIQPFFVLTWNIMHGLRKLLEPVLMLSREMFTQFSMMMGAFRLVEVNWKSDSRVQSI